MKYIYVGTKNGKVDKNISPQADPGDVARQISECNESKEFKKFGVAKIPIPKDLDITPFSKFRDYYYEDEE